MSPDFNNVATPYDFISRLVFGNALVDSQISLLNQIPKKSSILIVGGGTGWILEEISKRRPEGLQIIYVEVSEKMIALSRKRDTRQNNISFIHKPVEEYESDKLFDVIITPFFFDLFLKSDVKSLFSHIDKNLKSGGSWLYTDFVPAKYQTKIWQKILLKSMYLFFGLLSKVQARSLVDMDNYFERNYTLISEKWFYGKFIRSNIYLKSGQIS